MRRRSALLAAAGVVATAAVALPSIAAGPSHGDIRITSVVVNDGRSLVLGVNQAMTFPISITASDDSGISSVGPVGVWGPKYGVLRVSPMRCEQVSATTSTCTGSASVDTSRHQVWNDEAGTWFVDAQAHAVDGDDIRGGNLGGFSLKRSGKLTSPPPAATAAKGRPVTLTGWFARASWNDGRYFGYGDALIRLQFRPDGSDTWTTVKSVEPDISGVLTTTVTPDRSGTYAWYFPGDKWTGPATSPRHHITVTG
ncbi:calcium-binding protein [Peterkaempfera bronchialis]|uniref:Calcium-binding protein n=1 Tax=Peterkaempfera bronchialis TaxID=2126346 RepID=A0A345SWL8_9ACTN|nr:calcium-binding protein [Peterkaempfera bronchialis]AXI78123.1 calcium-binding protein [Peterkaempfera bronchialis]